MAHSDPSTDRTIGRVLEEYLVVSSRAGDRAAFELLARRWQARLLAHAWRLTGNRDAAAEAAQAAWLEIAKGLPKLLDERAFPAWVYRIVSRQCAQRIGQLQRDRALSQDLESEGQIAPDELGAPSGPDRLKLQRAVRALPPGQRAAVALFYFEELSIAEVAVALDVPAGTVKTRLMHARQTLRATLEEPGDA